MNKNGLSKVLAVTVAFISLTVSFLIPKSVIYALVNTSTDTITPTISSFTIPSSSSSFSVPITSFMATDDVGVTGYLLTETSTKPTFTVYTWSPTAQTSYSFSTVGLKTLYAWVRDSAGNISAPISANINVIIASARPLLGQTGYTCKYYVSNSGDDANSGTSDAQAWAHHPWMFNWTGKIVLAPGDTVCMKRGDIWSVSSTPIDPKNSKINIPFIKIEQSGSSGKYITTTAYGDTTKPKPVVAITGSANKSAVIGIDGYLAPSPSYIILDNLEIKHWSKYHLPTNPIVNYEQSGILFGGYKNNATHDWIITNNDIHNIPSIGIEGYTNSYNITIGDINTTTTATRTDYSNNIYDCGHAGILLTGTSYDTHESNFNIYHNYIHDIIGTALKESNAYGIALSGMSTSNGWPKYAYIRYNYVENIPTWEGIDTHGGSYIYFQNNYVKNCYASIATQTATGFVPSVLDHIYIDHNKLENPGALNQAKTQDYVFIQMNMEAKSKVSPSNSYIGYNELFYSPRPTSGGGYGIKVTEANNIVIENNYFHDGSSDASGAIQVVPGNNVVYRRNFIKDWNMGFFILPGQIPLGDFSIYDNIVKSDTPASAINFYFDKTKMNSLILSGNTNIYNNIFLLDNGAGPVINIAGLDVASGKQLNIKNNIIGFDKLNSSGQYLGIPSTITGSLNIDNNLYWNSSSTYPFYKGTTGNLNWSKWLSTYKFDNYSIGPNVDPKFINASLSLNFANDFNLLSNSPAINAGINVGLGTDYDGNKIIKLPDIGAYEYNSNITDNSSVLGDQKYNFALTLKCGSSGNEVMELQKLLSKLGYLKTTPNGNFGPATLSAVKEYQKVNNLNVDGIIGKQTRLQLNKL